MVETNEGSGWQTTETIHSCQYCARITLNKDYFSKSYQGYWVSQVPITVPEMRTAARTCPLFTFIMDRFEGEKAGQGFLGELDHGLMRAVAAADAKSGRRIFRSIRQAFSHKDITQRHKKYLYLWGRSFLFRCYIYPFAVDLALSQPPAGNLAIHLLPEARSRGIIPSDVNTYYGVHVGSSLAFESARTWIEECMTKHDECPGKSSGPAMTRLLDVGSSDDQSTIRLVETINLPGNDFSQWVALSYSWGGEQRLKTTRESIVSHREGIDLTILPQTIQDAVFVCRKIGVSYLWVDCLCIIQNDERDLERELAQMPYIYQGALVTIYAASARSVQDGFLQQRPLYYKEFPPIKLRFESSSDREDYLVLAEWVFHHYQDRGERDDPLDRRAWAFQERMLSPRLLVYSSRELTWQCRHGDRRVGNTRTDYTSSVIWRDRHDLPCVPGTEMPRWESIVQKYTRCSLTLPSDKLVAIAGVADVYRREHRMTYEAGLWKEDMPISLCWYVKSSGIQKIVREYRAPSWSWASVDGEISWEGHSYSESMVTLIDAETTPLFPAAPLAAVISGSLTLRGRMLPAILNFLVGENGIVHDVELRGILFAGGLKVNIDCLEQTWYESHSVKLDIWLLLIAVFAPVLGNFGGLVLRETSGGAYRRIGLFSNTFSILPYDDIFPGSLLEKEIKIE